MTAELMAEALSAFLARRGSNGGVGKSETLDDPWLQNPFVRAGVSSLYRFVRGVPVLAVTGSRDAEGEVKPLSSDHQLSTLLAQPSPMTFGAELWAQCLAYKKLDGHAFVLLYGKNGLWDRRGKEWPREMQAINTRCVSYQEGDLDPVTGAVRQWRVRQRNGSEKIVPSESMLHLRDFDPRDPIGCSSPLAPVWSGMEADLNVDVYAAKWLANVGALGLWLQVKGAKPGDDEMKALLAKFNDSFGGAANSGKTFASGEDLEIKSPPTQSAKDMEMPRLREWNRDTVKAVLGVTDFEVGRVADYNRANSESAKAWLVTNTVLPELEAFESAFWGHVAEPVSRQERADVWMRFDRDKIAALKPALAESATTARTLIETGFDPVQVSEKLELGLDFVEIDEPEPPPPPVVAAPPPPPVEPTKSGPHIWVKRDKPSKPSRAFALRIQHQWADQAERRLGVKWRKFTGRRYAETIRLVRNLADVGPVSPSVVETIMGDAAAWREGAKAAAESGLKGSGARLVDNFGAELGGFRRLDVGQEAYQVAAARRVGQMVEVGTALRRRIQGSISRAIADAGTDGVSVDALERVLEQRFKGVLPSNAATVARTEVGMFSSDVRRSLMVAEGVDEHEWSASMDEHTREDHRIIDGERRPLGQRFSNGLLYPLESGAPPEQVVNCRCVELPYLREAE